MIRRSTERLHALVEDLLLVAQIEAKRIELTLGSIDMVDLGTRRPSPSRPAAAEKNVTSTSSRIIRPRCSPTRTGCGRCSTISSRTRVKFTNDGGTVTVSVAGSGDAVLLTIADTGIGIPPDEQGQVFSRFFRASTAMRRAIPGTGLGLAISRALVEQHGGTISLSSWRARARR